MMAGGRPGRGTPASEEDFIDYPTTTTVPSVEPLRITKRSNNHEVRPGSSSSSQAQSPHPTAFRRPTFPAAGVPQDDYPAEHSALAHPHATAAEKMAQYQQQRDQQQQQQQQQPPPQHQHPAFSASAAGSDAGSDRSVGRHVSVVHSDAYPTPPAFRHREGSRPARLRADSNQSRHTPSPPHQQPYAPPATTQAADPYPQYHQQYWPPPSRMTSTSTTAGRRGSPPPPETPATATAETPPFRIGDPPRQQTIPGPAGRHRPPPVQTSATPSPVASTPARRPWTPTEQPGSYPHGPPTVWHGTGGQNSEENLRQHETGGSAGGRSSASSHTRVQSVNDNAPEVFEQDFQRLNMSSSPPPSYASLSHAGRAAMGGGSRSSSQGATTAQGYPDEKRTLALGVGAAADMPPPPSSHPAFQREPSTPHPAERQSTQSPAFMARQQQQQDPHATPSLPQLPPQGLQQQPSGGSVASSAAASQQFHPAEQHQEQQPQQQQFSPPPQGAGPTVPPQLPEGWMAHLDSNSGAYYYIYIPTSHTQWEPPTPEEAAAIAAAAAPPAPTPGPSNVPAPLNLTQSHLTQTHQMASIQSPGFPPGTPGFGPPATPGFPPPFSPGLPMKHNPYDSMPPTPGFGQFGAPPLTPLPNAGIAMYNPAPVNGEYFGPYLRYTNMNLEHGIWYGSILLVTEYKQPPTVHIHRSRDLSPNPPQLKAVPIYTHRTWMFFRYDIELPMEGGDMWTYAISTPLGCTRYEFLVAGRDDRNWRFIAHSGNDFSMKVSGEERGRLGGPGFMWKDLMQKHLDCGGFHAQIGTGGQMYADRMWRELAPLKEWLQIRGKENRKNAQWTTRHDEDVTHAYFHYYTSNWDQPHLREAFAQIPYMFQLDDHDIFEGFGSHPEYLQFSAIFKNIGRIGLTWYLLFQHHATLEILHSKSDDNDLFTITGTGWHFLKYMGPSIAVIGLDTRSERNQHQVMAGPSYQGLFPKIATLPQSIQHAIVVTSVPLIFPRMETAEHVMHTMATGKKAVTGTYNLLGKVVGSAAGVIGAKEVVGSGFQSVKKAVGKHGLMGSVVNVFGEVDLLEDLKDHWTHETKDLERTYLIRTLQGISHSRGLRVTFLSGSVNVCGAGLVHDPNKPLDHKTMYQIITSSMIDAPPASYVTKMLHNNKILYIPQNGLRSTNQPSDTKEDMMEIFQAEVDGRAREQKKLMAKRGYVIFTGFMVDPGTEAKGPNTSLAVDFIVQGEGVYAMTGKYGPVVVPRLEHGY